MMRRGLYDPTFTTAIGQSDDGPPPRWDHLMWRLTITARQGSQARAHRQEGRGRKSHAELRPELVAMAVREWIAAVGAKTAYIERGSPWKNATVRLQLEAP